MEYEAFKVIISYSTWNKKCRFDDCDNKCVMIVSGNNEDKDESYDYTHFCESHLCKRCGGGFDKNVTSCPRCDRSRCRAPDCKKLIGIHHFYCDKHKCAHCGEMNITNNCYCKKCHRMCPGCGEYIGPMKRHCGNCECKTNECAETKTRTSLFCESCLHKNNECKTNECTKMKTSNSLFCESCLHKNNIASMRNRWLTK